VKLGIGLLAHDEATGIARTLDSLFDQVGVGKAADPIESIHVLILANGCSDGTADAAGSWIKRRVLCADPQGHYGIEPSQPDPLDGTQSYEWFAGATGRDDPVLPTGTRVTWEVRELRRAGKSNAWNHCVHRLLPRSCDAVMMVDADIIFAEPTVVVEAVQTLCARQEIWVVTDIPVKVHPNARHPEWQRRISVAASDLAREEGRTAICGQFYCGRGEILRRVVMPPDLAVEDGFLRAMIVTNMFTGPERTDRVYQLQGAHHFFEAERGILPTLRHETRLMLGSTLNSFLFADLHAHANQVGGAGEWIRQRLIEDPHWYAKTMTRRIEGSRSWMIPRSLLLNRARGLRGMPFLAKLRRLPLVAAAVIFDLAAAAHANRVLRKHRGVGYW